MALRRSGRFRFGAAVSCIVLTSGCAASKQAPVRSAAHAPSVAPSARPLTGATYRPGAKSQAKAELEAIERDCPDARGHGSGGERAAWWESFRRTNEALLTEIERRAEELKAGPIGNRARELASLRLAATARDLIAADAGGAAEALEKAVSLDAGNGYAWLWLAYVTAGPRALEAAGRAERTLPRDPGVRCELRGLKSMLRDA